MPRRRNQRQQHSPTPDTELVPTLDVETPLDDASPSDPGPSKIENPMRDLGTATAVLDGQEQAHVTAIEETKALPALEVLYCEGMQKTPFTEM